LKVKDAWLELRYGSSPGVPIYRTNSKAVLVEFGRAALDELAREVRIWSLFDGGASRIKRLERKGLERLLKIVVPGFQIRPQSVEDLPTTRQKGDEKHA